MRLQKMKNEEDNKIWRTVSLPEDIHEKLRHISEIEDRPINRQLARIINQVYEDNYSN
jgi:hypothetical protein